MPSVSTPSAQFLSTATSNKELANTAFNPKHPLAATIGSAHTSVQKAKEHYAMGLLGSASVILTLEMLKIANALRMYDGVRPSVRPSVHPSVRPSVRPCLGIADAAPLARHATLRHESPAARGVPLR
eukprot:SAG22_NODE_85_length_21510_cov_6.472187_19_plen_127_part_00